MHTFRGNNGTVIIHDGDYKGKATIFSITTHEEITVDAEDLVNFAKSAIKSELISLIEKAYIMGPSRFRQGSEKLKHTGRRPPEAHYK